MRIRGLKRPVFKILGWALFWAVVGWVYGNSVHAHAWEIMPVLGGLYGGMTAVLSILCFRLPVWRTSARLAQAVGAAVLASCLSGLLIKMMIGGLTTVGALLFFPVAGFVFGLIDFLTAAQEDEADQVLE
jgi:hypothetical protein